MKKLRLNFQVAKKDNSNIEIKEAEGIVDEMILFLESKGYEIGDEPDEEE